MDSSILYILGAGASCGVNGNILPLSNNFSIRLSDFHDFLKDYAASAAIEDGKTIDGIGEFLEQLKWLSTESSNHASVDTLAKKLFFKNDVDSLKRLKAVLTSYFLIVQAINSVDMRYDSFLATVLTLDSAKKVRLPPNLKILTWNYDTQLEKSLYQFCDDTDHVEEEITKNKSIVRINGHCGTNKEFVIKQLLNPKSKNAIIAYGIDVFMRLIQDYELETTLRFAWEKITTDGIANEDLAFFG